MPNFRTPRGERPGHRPRLALRTLRIRSTSTLIASALGSAAIVLFAGCGGPADRSAHVADHVAFGGTLVIAGPADLDQANPLITADAWTREVNRFLLFMTLIRYGPGLTLEPYLARAWELHGDTAVTFTLRDDVFWHDGTKTSAHDVRFTYAHAMAPQSTYPSAGHFAQWTSVEVMDSFEIRFTFRPHADPLSSAALLPIAPQHLLGAVPAAELQSASFNKAPVGNGPFRFVAQRANDRWVFEANPAFPGELGGRPFVDRLVWRVVPERTAQVTELLTGNAHVILSVPAENFAELAERPDIRGIERPSFKYWFVGWNGRRAPFSDASIRRALTMAIDRASIVQVMRSGSGTVAVGPIHPNHWAFSATLLPLPYDTAAARALLAEAGLSDRDGDGILESAHGERFAFELSFQAGNAFSRNAAEMIQTDLARVGVRANLRPVDWSALVAAVSSPGRDFDAVLMGWQADFRIQLRDLFHSASRAGPFQLASYANASLDEALDRAEATVDRNAALPLWRDVQRILRDDQPWSFLLYFPDQILASERVRGVERMDIRGVLAGAREWSLSAAPLVATR